VFIVHAGNRIDAPGRAVDRFPAGRVPAITAEVQRLLATLQPTRVISNAAAGADLIVLHTAQTLGVPVHAVVPIERAEFVRQSVIDSGAEWLGLFDDVLGHAMADPLSDVVTGDLAADGEWFHEANTRLLRLAAQLAQHDGDAPLLAFTIRPLVNHGDSMTDHFADIAEQAGLVVLTLDPRPGAVGGIAVSGPSA
jgi:hypothetical protein